MKLNFAPDVEHFRREASTFSVRTYRQVAESVAEQWVSSAHIPDSARRWQRATGSTASPLLAFGDAAMSYACWVRA